MIQIPDYLLPDFIGKGVHLSWAKKGCWWHLHQILGNEVIVITPKTGEKLVAKASDVCYIKKHLPKELAVDNT
jgi:hypothetical protein